MNRNIGIVLVALALLAAAFVLLKKSPGPGAAPGAAQSDSQDGVGPGSTENRSGDSTGSSETTAAAIATGAAPVAEPGGDSPGASNPAASSGATPGMPNQPSTVAGGGKPGVLAPGSNAYQALHAPDAPLPADVDPSKLSGGQLLAKRPMPGGGDGYVGQPGDDGDLPPASKVPAVPTLAGVAGPRVWLVASDAKNLKSAPKGGAPFEIGLPEGSKASAWKNRAGSKFGDGIRVKGSSTGTYVKGVSTTAGNFDAIALCAPGARECINAESSQIRFGLDVNHNDHWLAGADKAGKSSKGGSSFTVLFVAARASAAANPILEHQNGEGGATRGPFLGWVGPDLVGSIHGTQGIVGTNAVAMPSPYTGSPTAPVTPMIYSMRFDRKKSELRLYQVGEKVSETAAQAIEKGDGPDNDQYATLALGSKTPGVGGATYVFEAAAFPRALTDSELCSIHKEWNKKYALKISSGKLKPCSGS